MGRASWGCVSTNRETLRFCAALRLADRRTLLGHCSQGEDADLTKGRSQTPDIVWIACGDHGGIELDCGRDHKCIDCVSRGKLQSCKHVASLLSNRASKLGYADAWILQHVVDGGVALDASAHFSEHRSRNPDKSTPFIGETKDRGGAVG
jgi:hypothetical protein